MSTNNINDPKSVFENGTPKFVFRKADLKPGDKKYQEVTAVQVDERTSPTTAIASSPRSSPRVSRSRVGQW